MMRPLLSPFEQSLTTISKGEGEMKRSRLGKMGETLEKRLQGKMGQVRHSAQNETGGIVTLSAEENDRRERLMEARACLVLAERLIELSEADDILKVPSYLKLIEASQETHQDSEVACAKIVVIVEEHMRSSLYVHPSPLILRELVECEFLPKKTYITIRELIWRESQLQLKRTILLPAYLSLVLLRAKEGTAGSVVNVDGMRQLVRLNEFGEHEKPYGYLTCAKAERVLNWRPQSVFDEDSSIFDIDSLSRGADEHFFPKLCDGLIKVGLAEDVLKIARTYTREKPGGRSPAIDCYVMLLQDPSVEEAVRQQAKSDLKELFRQSGILLTYGRTQRELLGSGALEVLARAAPVLSALPKEALIGIDEELLEKSAASGIFSQTIPYGYMNMAAVQQGCHWPQTGWDLARQTAARLNKPTDRCEVLCDLLKRERRCGVESLETLRELEGAMKEYPVSDGRIDGRFFALMEVLASGCARLEPMRVQALVARALERPEPELMQRSQNPSLKFVEPLTAAARALHRSASAAL